MLQLACPFAPFITQELWERLGGEGEVNDAPWPEWDVKLTQGEMVEWVVQVNGRIRDRVELPFDSPQEEVVEVVFARPRTREWITGKAVVKKIFVPNKLINIVVR